MTGTGYRHMLINKTCKVETLELISKICNVPITYFFYNAQEYKEVDELNQDLSYCKECVKKDAKIEILQEQNHEKEEIISSLNQTIGSQKALLKNNGEGSTGHTNSKAG